MNSAARSVSTFSAIAAPIWRPIAAAVSSALASSNKSVNVTITPTSDAVISFLVVAKEVLLKSLPSVTPAADTAG